MNPKLHTPFKTPDGSFACHIIDDGAGTTDEDREAGRGICTVYASTFAECRRRAKLVFDALRKCEGESDLMGACKGMLESVDLILSEQSGLPEMTRNVLRGFMLDEPEKVRAAIEKATKGE